MRTTKALLLAALSSFFIISCQKEVDYSSGNGNGNNSNIIGNYDFVGMTATTNSTVEATGAGLNEKSITTSYYITKNNIGTVTITADKFTSTGVGYDIDTTMHFKMYSDNILVLEDDLPFQATIPPTSGVSTYRKIGSDSLYFDGGMVTSGPVGGTGGGSTASMPSGCKYSWSGDTLIMKTSIKVEQTQTVMGITMKTTNSGTQIAKLKKKP